MNFEEQFPSLGPRIITNFVLCSDIKKHCLDKQRVRDALIKSAKQERKELVKAGNGARGLDQNTFAYDVMKELGLK